MSQYYKVFKACTRHVVNIQKIDKHKGDAQYDKLETN